MKHLDCGVALLALIFSVSPFKMYAQTAVSSPPESRPTRQARPEIIETRPIDIKGCISGSRSEQFVFKDDETFRQAIRNDASREWCRKNLESIDFKKYSLLGIELVTDYCDRPPGLAHQLIKNTTTKKYLFDISYHTPPGICRRMGQYAIWVVVPKIPDDYEVVFKVRKIPSNESER